LGLAIAIGHEEEAKVRPERETMLKAARRCKLVSLWCGKFDRWGRSLLDLIQHAARTH
jgi:hypothetical protein